MVVSKKVLITFTAGISAIVLVAPTANARPTRAEASLLQTVNQVRAQHGLAALTLDVRLERSARAHSSHMLRTGTFAHGAFRSRIARYGARGPAVGENLAWGVGSSATAQGVVQMWLASPSHRANLLRPGFRRIGIGRRVGTFAGYGGAAVVTANFAGY